jgi:hypothetical protein
MQQQKPLEGAQLVIMTIALSLATFMQVLDSTIANVAIPTIAGNNYKEQGEKEEQTLTFAALLYRLLRGLSLRICAHIVLHDLLNSSAEPTCLPKRPACCDAGQSFFLL